MGNAEWLAGHMLVDPDGNEVLPGATLPTHRENETMTFHAITRAPGDGTGTNGKIEVTVAAIEATITGTVKGKPMHWRCEYYPPTGYRVVPRPSTSVEGRFDPDA